MEWQEHPGHGDESPRRSVWLATFLMLIVHSVATLLDGHGAVVNPIITRCASNPHPRHSHPSTLHLHGCCGNLAGLSLPR